MGDTYLTTEELSTRIKYDCRTIRERLKDSVLIDGIICHVPYAPKAGVTGSTPVRRAISRYFNNLPPSLFRIFCLIVLAQ